MPNYPSNKSKKATSHNFEIRNRCQKRQNNFKFFTMISSRFLLIAAVVCSPCQSTTGFRTGGSFASRTRTSSEQTEWPESSKKLSVDGSVRYASLVLPPDEVDSVDETAVKKRGGGVTMGQRIKKYFSYKNEGMTSRQRLAKMGLDVFLSYGFVQNVSMTISTSLAWYLFSSRVRLMYEYATIQDASPMPSS
jgi:hypothetical protein